MGMIGFWYNKALFEQAGITAPPATWDEYLAAVEKLRAAGIDPLAIAGKDKWPSMHLWTYLVLRNGGGDALSEMIQSGNWNTDACTKAGEDVLALNALDPYQAGYKSADYNAEACSRRQRQRRHGADGPVGAIGRDGPERGQEGLWRRPRLVRLPDGRRAAPAQPPTVSVAATAIAVGVNAPPEAIDLPQVSSAASTTATKLTYRRLGPVHGGRHRKARSRTRTSRRPGGSRRCHFMQLYP
jgi:hypothetical protein